MSGPNNRKEPDVRRRRRISGLDEEGHMNPEFLVPLIPIVAIIAVAAVKVARLRATRPESPSIDITARFEANRQEASLVVRSHSRGLFLKRWCYLTPYRGL